MTDWVDPFANTRPIQPTRAGYRGNKKRAGTRGCMTIGLALAIGLLIYLFLPIQTNLLLLGLDVRDPANNLGRSDTMILVSVNPLQPEIKMLSIPRDLWVTIPGYGDQRINAAHFFGENEEIGLGPALAMETVKANFGVEPQYYARLQFQGFQAVVDSLDPVSVNLLVPMSGYDSGEQLLNGEEALAFVRDRQGSDDFFRMERGQLFLRSFWKDLRAPKSWQRLPRFLWEITRSLDTNLPVWLWPRLGVAFLRASPDDVVYRVISRDMVIPFTTSEGAQVLAPVWEEILPVVDEMFR